MMWQKMGDYYSPSKHIHLDTQLAAAAVGRAESDEGNFNLSRQNAVEKTRRTRQGREYELEEKL